MNRYLFLSPMAFVLAALVVLTFSSTGGAEERGMHSHGSAAFVNADGDFVGAGNATHMGNYTEIGNAAIAPTGQLTASATYTDVHGNELFATFSGQINATGGITATVTYDGGTGRFANASGTATLTGQIQLDGSIEVSVAGTINY